MLTESATNAAPRLGYAGVDPNDQRPDTPRHPCAGRVCLARSRTAPAADSRRDRSAKSGNGRPAPSWRLTLAAAALIFAVQFCCWTLVLRWSQPGSLSGAGVIPVGAGSALVTLVACATWHGIVRRREKRLTAVVRQLTQLIQSYQSNPADPGRFENPHLVHCRDVFQCECESCPAFDRPQERCWQIAALSRAALGESAPRIEIQQCMECEVYRRSCPTTLTELGESFNNLMFLLEAEGRRLARMQGQMLEKEKMAAVGQLAAGIAHEVCNPLSSISAVVQMLKRTPEGKALLDDLGLIESHIQRITSTVRELTGLAHPVSERWELVDLGDILADVARLIRFDRRARNVEIRLVPPAPPRKTFAVRDQLVQVFINLALNSLDAMPDGGTLTLRTEERPGRMLIRVRDTGCGIDESVGRQVFVPFFTTKPPGRGTGLGLSVSYGIVQEHGGTIDFTSQAGHGTEFVVDIPVLKARRSGRNGSRNHPVGR